MENVPEVARVVKHWLTVKADAEKAPGAYVELDSEESIEFAKEGLDHEIKNVREQVAGLLFAGQLDWLRQDNEELERALPAWFLPGSGEERDLEEHALRAPTDVRSALTFLSDLMDAWGRGEGRPQENPEYVEGTSPPGTQYCMYDGQQWLYSPVASGEGADWQPLEARMQAVAEPAQLEGEQPESEQARPDAEEQTAPETTVDLGTMEQAQRAAVEVTDAAQEILADVLERNPGIAEGVPPERMKQLALEALKAQQ